jgi:phospholipid transport system transporter-binding protein
MKLPVNITFAKAGAALAQLQSAVAQAGSGSPVQVDASAMAEFDTSAIAVLLEGQRIARQRGIGFEVTAPPAKLRQLAALYGVEGLLGLQASPASAT